MAVLTSTSAHVTTVPTWSEINVGVGIAGMKIARKDRPKGRNRGVVCIVVPVKAIRIWKKIARTGIKQQSFSI